jgi:hypothetical protein
LPPLLLCGHILEVFRRLLQRAQVDSLERMMAAGYQIILRHPVTLEERKWDGQGWIPPHLPPHI